MVSFTTEDLPDQFRCVISALNQDALPEFAILQRRKYENLPDDDLTTWPVEIGSNLSFGSIHVLVHLEFNDGIHWLLKLPCWGFKNAWNAQSAQKLQNEAMVMKLLEQEDIVKVPRVIDYDCSCNNTLKCAYILLDYIDAKTLHEVWFESSEDQDKQTDIRRKTMEDVARMQIRLSQYQFDHCGMLAFDEDGRPSGVKPLIFENVDNVLDKLCDASLDDVISPESAEFGPFTSAIDYFKTHTSFFEDPDHRKKKIVRARRKLMRLFLDYTQKVAWSYDKNSLAHNDLASQNILLAPDGSIRAVIDWHNAHVMPAGVGNLACPFFLVVDKLPIVPCVEHMHPKIFPCLEEADPAFAAQFPPLRDQYSAIYESTLYHMALEDQLTDQDIYLNKIKIPSLRSVLRRSYVLQRLFAGATRPRTRSVILVAMLNEYCVVALNSDRKSYQHQPRASAESTVSDKYSNDGRASDTEDDDDDDNSEDGSESDDSGSSSDEDEDDNENKDRDDNEDKDRDDNEDKDDHDDDNEDDSSDDNDVSNPTTLRKERVALPKALDIEDKSILLFQLILDLIQEGNSQKFEEYAEEIVKWLYLQHD